MYNAVITAVCAYECCQEKWTFCNWFTSFVSSDGLGTKKGPGICTLQPKSIDHQSQPLHNKNMCNRHAFNKVQRSLLFSATLSSESKFIRTSVMATEYSFQLPTTPNTQTRSSLLDSVLKFPEVIASAKLLQTNNQIKKIQVDLFYFKPCTFNIWIRNLATKQCRPKS